MLKNNQNGNVLFLILIAVMLFGALTAAVTRSNRGNDSMDRERGSISASDFMAYAGSVEKTVARILGDEISENALSFENDKWQLNDGTDVETADMFTACTTDACKVFAPAGGGIDAKVFDNIVVDSPVDEDIKSGHGGVYVMKVTGVGSSAHDLVLMIAAINQNTCKQINKSMGITNPGDVPPADTWAGATLYDGTFTGPEDGTDEIGDIATQIVGKTSGCISRSGGAYGDKDNYFYQVLLPR